MPGACGDIFKLNFRILPGILRLPIADSPDRILPLELSGMPNSDIVCFLDLPFLFFLEIMLSHAIGFDASFILQQLILFKILQNGWLPLRDHLDKKSVFVSL
jgi:hypothetical protein